MNDLEICFRGIDINRKGILQEPGTMRPAVIRLTPWVTYVVQYVPRYGTFATFKIECLRSNSNVGRGSSYSSPLYVSTAAGLITPRTDVEFNYLMLDLNTAEGSVAGGDVYVYLGSKKT